MNAWRDRSGPVSNSAHEKLCDAGHGSAYHSPFPAAVVVVNLPTWVWGLGWGLRELVLVQEAANLSRKGLLVLILLKDDVGAQTS